MTLPQNFFVLHARFSKISIPYWYLNNLLATLTATVDLVVTIMKTAHLLLWYPLDGDPYLLEFISSFGSGRPTAVPQF